MTLIGLAVTFWVSPSRSAARGHRQHADADDHGARGHRGEPRGYAGVLTPAYQKK